MVEQEYREIEDRLPCSASLPKLHDSSHPYADDLDDYCDEFLSEHNLKYYIRKHDWRGGYESLMDDGYSTYKDFISKRDGRRNINNGKRERIIHYLSKIKTFVGMNEQKFIDNIFEKTCKKHSVGYFLDI